MKSITFNPPFPVSIGKCNTDGAAGKEARKPRLRSDGFDFGRVCETYRDARPYTKGQ